MRFQKTEKGRAELTPGVRTLGQRARTFLLLADGQKTIADIGCVLAGDVHALAQDLVAQGYLDGAAPPHTRSNGKGSVPVSEKSATKSAISSPHHAPTVAADQFEGRRSLATTRMFLFDISERMFARQSPQLALQFRDDLRNAKDRESMMEVSRQMLSEVERVAGAARADSISERLAMMLPPEG